MDMRKAMRETLELAVASAMPEGSAEDPLSLAHMRTMEARLRNANVSEGKLGRWLGWMQAALVAADVGVTLEDVKMINMRNA